MTRKLSTCVASHRLRYLFALTGILVTASCAAPPPAHKPAVTPPPVAKPAVFVPRYDTTAIHGMSRPQLVSAIAAVRADLASGKQANPGAWATNQEDLGRLLVALGRSDRNAQPLVEAMDAYRQALTVRDKTTDAMGWARTNRGLGTAQFEAALMLGETSLAEQAAASHREALTVYSRAETPEPWSETQRQLAYALDTLAERDKTVQRYEDTVWHYRAALAETLRDRQPVLWADTKERLALALTKLALLKQNKDMLNEARFHLLAAGLAHRENGDEDSFRATQSRLATMERAMKAMGN